MYMYMYSTWSTHRYRNSYTTVECTHTHVHVSTYILYTCTYIYMYMYIYRRWKLHTTKKVSTNMWSQCICTCTWWKGSGIFLENHEKLAATWDWTGASDLSRQCYCLSYGHQATASLHNSQYHSLYVLCTYNIWDFVLSTSSLTHAPYSHTEYCMYCTCTIHVHVVCYSAESITFHQNAFPWFVGVHIDSQAILLHHPSLQSQCVWRSLQWLTEMLFLWVHKPLNAVKKHVHVQL